MCIVYSWHLCWSSVTCICVGLFLGPLFSSIGVCVCFMPAPCCLGYGSFDIHFPLCSPCSKSLCLSRVFCGSIWSLWCFFLFLWKNTTKLFFKQIKHHFTLFLKTLFSKHHYFYFPGKKTELGKAKDLVQCYLGDKQH